MRFAILGLIALWLGLHGFAAAATTLTFEQLGAENGDFLDQRYGDRVAAETDSIGRYEIGNEGATPNVTVRYGGGSTTELRVWGEGYADLQRAVYQFTAPGLRGDTIELRADPGFEVVLYGFEVGYFGDVNNQWEGLGIRDARVGPNLFGVPAGSTLSGTTGNEYVFLGDDVLRAPFLQLTLKTLVNPNRRSWVGLGNLRFGQVAVPEPATGALLGLGLAGLAIRRRA